MKFYVVLYSSVWRKFGFVYSILGTIIMCSSFRESQYCTLFLVTKIGDVFSCRVGKYFIVNMLVVLYSSIVLYILYFENFQGT